MTSCSSVRMFLGPFNQKRDIPLKPIEKTQMKPYVQRKTLTPVAAKRPEYKCFGFRSGTHLSASVQHTRFPVFRLVSAKRWMQQGHC